MGQTQMSTLNIDSKVYARITELASHQQRCIRYVAEDALEAFLLLFSPIYGDLREHAEQIAAHEKQRWEHAERISALECQVRCLTESISAKISE